MPSTRKRKSRRAGARITPAVIEAFIAGDKPTLDRLLGIKPWMPSPLEADSPEPPEWSKRDGTAWTAAWPEVYALRREIEHAGA